MPPLPPWPDQQNNAVRWFFSQKYAVSLSFSYLFIFTWRLELRLTHYATFKMTVHLDIWILGAMFYRLVQISAYKPPVWDIRVFTPSLTVCLLYPQILLTGAVDGQSETVSSHRLAPGLSTPPILLRDWTTPTSPPRSPSSRLAVCSGLWHSAEWLPSYSTMSSPSPSGLTRVWTVPSAGRDRAAH